MAAQAQSCDGAGLLLLYQQHLSISELTQSSQRREQAHTVLWCSRVFSDSTRAHGLGGFFPPVCFTQSKCVS